MAEIDIERKNNDSGGNKNNNSKWWVLLVLVSIGIIVLWFAFSDRTNIDPEEEGLEDIGDSLYIREPLPGDVDTTAEPFSEPEDQLEPIE